MKALVKRFISLCENGSALAGPISTFTTQQRTPSSNTRYDSLTELQVEEYGPTFDTNDSNDTTLSNSESSKYAEDELHQQQN